MGGAGAGPAVPPYPSALMAEFQWWLLLVGLVAGGGLVAVVTMDGRRREEDIAGLERRAETTWIVERLAGSTVWVDPPTVDAVLRLHREYLGMAPPDQLIVEGDPGALGAGSDVEVDLDRDPDRGPDEVGHDRGRGADEDLPRAGEEQAPARQEAHARADGEEGAER
jgi:hypothetical protein